MRAKKKVDVERLAAALPDFPFAYLITVNDNCRVHTVTVEPALRGDVLDVGLVGAGTRKNLAHRSGVTLLWPPHEPGGYSLIVDGDAIFQADTGDSDAVQLSVAPTRALLHREAGPDSPGLHDCVVFSLPA